MYAEFVHLRAGMITFCSSFSRESLRLAMADQVFRVLPRGDGNRARGILELRSGN